VLACASARSDTTSRASTNHASSARQVGVAVETLGPHGVGAATSSVTELGRECMVDVRVKRIYDDEPDPATATAS
jgi:hypothetical protein